jgi:hypothetical protein
MKYDSLHQDLAFSLLVIFFFCMTIMMNFYNNNEEIEGDEELLFVFDKYSTNS